MNPKYALKAKEEIDKLLRVGFIRPVKQATWLSLILVVPKKNGKIKVCVDYQKLNVATITDGFPLPFTDGILDVVVGHEMYNFLDEFSVYNQIRMHPNDQEKTLFVTEWGVFVAVVMIFSIKTATSTFQHIIMEIFEEHIPTFMHVFLDDLPATAENVTTGTSPDVSRKMSDYMLLQIRQWSNLVEVKTSGVHDHLNDRSRIRSHVRRGERDFMARSAGSHVLKS